MFCKKMLVMFSMNFFQVYYFFPVSKWFFSSMLLCSSGVFAFPAVDRLKEIAYTNFLSNIWVQSSFQKRCGCYYYYYL